MKLPHGEALIFAKEVLSKNSNNVLVRCEFNTLPSLAMFIEAAAQSSSAFNSRTDNKAKNAFLTMAKDVVLLNNIKKKIYVINVEMKIEINNIKQFYFTVLEENNDIEYASGFFTLLVQE